VPEFREAFDLVKRYGLRCVDLDLSMAAADLSDKIASSQT
jgi:hypothetical protein